ncbi:broad substrate specificity ATP-binding cassette transporter ABCG2-like [Gordionus sp. m RMFG-2023]|uniref:broad substrate specificity ATP-binding cassette transporter ABCG2-like n=1 Tax=Gordionus sp. m RMFG-2023 TaxID=3053472 RepID=UPI0031FD3144
MIKTSGDQDIRKLKKEAFLESNYDTTLPKLSFKQAVLTFKDLTYIIPAHRKHFWKPKLPPFVVLDHVSGIFTPGVNAIMGPSGGGKTSLLTVLGGRRDIDTVEGTILMNGKPISKNFLNESGFVTQEDIMMGTLTVRENIMFSASLRLSTKIATRKKKIMVERVIQELNLYKCADTKVGTELIRGISGGERKRCNIGIELVTIPSILFLDEPTSGLDASTAVTVVLLLKKLSDKGCNIIMSIHQPRYDIFKAFNNLILLSSGQIVYHGLSSQALDYFSAIGFECEVHNNPADFFLDVVEKNSKRIIKDEDGHIKDMGDDENAGYHGMPKVDLAMKYDKSLPYTKVQCALKEIDKIKPELKKQNFIRKLTKKGRSTMYSTNFCEQFGVVSRRTIMNIIRNPQPVLVQSFTMIMYSFIVGFIYFHVDNSIKFGLQNRIGALFFILMNQVFGNLSAIELFMKERVLYVHETTNGFYRVSVYFLSKLLCDLIPMRFVPVLLVSIIAYWMIGLKRYAGNYFIFILSLICLTTSASSMALLASVSYDTIGVATNYCGLVFVFMMVFGGLFVNLQSISPKIRWLKYFSIFRYAYNALLINEIKDASFCGAEKNFVSNGTEEPACVYGNNYLESQGIPYKTRWNLWSNHFALFCMILIFWCFSYIQLRRLRKNAK